jgi:hypothetical protein
LTRTEGRVPKSGVKSFFMQSLLLPKISFPLSDMAATTWLLLGVLLGSVWAQTPCETPDVTRAACNCSGVTYDFSQMKDAVTGSTCVTSSSFPRSRTLLDCVLSLLSASLQGDLLAQSTGNRYWFLDFRIRQGSHRQALPGQRCGLQLLFPDGQEWPSSLLQRLHF